jgi:hypothetical protein
MYTLYVCGGSHTHHTVEHFVSDCRPIVSAVNVRFRQVRVRSIKCTDFVNVFNCLWYCLWLHKKTGFDQRTPVLTPHQPTRKQSVTSRQAVTTVLFTFVCRPGMGGRVTLQAEALSHSHFIYSLVLATRSFKPSESESSLSLPCSLTASIPSPARDTDILLNTWGEGVGQKVGR